MNGVEKGRRGEDLAAVFLLQSGYRILCRNWRVKAGEIDIIAQVSGVLVFCEVKARSSVTFGSGAEAVNWQKQQRIVRAALVFMQQYSFLDQPCRFDVVEILLPPGGGPSIRHIPNAFGQ